MKLSKWRGTPKGHELMCVHVRMCRHACLHRAGWVISRWIAF